MPCCFSNPFFVQTSTVPVSADDAGLPTGSAADAAGSGALAAHVAGGGAGGGAAGGTGAGALS